MAFDHGHALLIGVGTYIHIPNASIPISAKDAQQVCDVLCNERFCGYKPENVIFLHDQAASREGILQGFQNLAAKAKPEDTVLIYYSGHGEYGTDGIFYMTANDSKGTGNKVTPGTGISEQDLLTAIRAIPASKLIFFFNACHSGEVSPRLGLGEEAESFGSTNLPNATADAILASGSGRIIVTACREGQHSWIGKGEISIFARALVDGLKGRARYNAGYIGAFGLYEYLFEYVKEAAIDLGCEQEPELTVLKGIGPFPVALYRGASELQSFDTREELPEEAVVRWVSERIGRREFARISNINTAGGAYIAGNINTGGGDFTGGNQTKLNIDGVIHSTVVVGNQNTVQATYFVGGHLSDIDPSVLRRDYLNALFETVGAFQLSGIDPKAASESNASLSLSAVYTALLTQSSEVRAQGGGGVLSLEARQLSALEQLNQHKHLVLLGDPGSGKSTFVSFVALCLAGEALGHPQANIALLTVPLPKDEPGRQGEKEPKPQPWDHGALLPVRVVLRDFAARGLPEAGQKTTARHLWKFIEAELESGNLQSFAPHLDKELHEQGGLLLVDGLDEVPEAESRRVQIRQAVEDFARGYPKVRILVTSRTYAYKNQDWRLQGFTDTLLAPFSRRQIESFVDHWYAQITEVRSMNQEDAQGRAVLLKNAIFGSERLLTLAERPLLLTLMASLHAWRGGTLPEKREQLYADTVDLLLDWWESPKTVRDRRGQVMVQNPSLAEWLKVDRQKVRVLLDELAYQAHASQPELTGTADVPQAALVDGLMHVTNNPEVNPVRLIEFLRDRAGLLLPRGVGVFTFPHRTFQEYLTACYLTDHDYPDKIAELACNDINRWREVAMLAGAKAGRGTASAVWSLVDALCYEGAPKERCQREDRLWGAHLAAQMVVENGGMVEINDRNRPKVERVRGWLMHILQFSALPARERALAGDHLAKLNDPRSEVLRIDKMKFCFVPGGPFQMGEGEKQHTINLQDYWISQYPVTNAQYMIFAEAGGYHEARYWPEAELRGFWREAGFRGYEDKEPREHPRFSGGQFDLANHPVVGVSWYEALAFVRWLSEYVQDAGWLPTDWQVCLPGEAEWEKAAKGGALISEPALVCPLDGLSGTEKISCIENPQPIRIFPWGDKFSEEKANTAETAILSTSPVGCFVGGDSPYNCQDMAGNVWEWTRSISKDYPYALSDAREDLKAGEQVPRVLRGGAWNSNGKGARCASRTTRAARYNYSNNIGFRVVIYHPPL